MHINNQPFELLLDTGSALLAVPVNSCVSCDTQTPNPPLILSETVNPVLCESCQLCCDGNEPQLCPPNACPFNISYVDSSNISGKRKKKAILL